MNSHQRVWVALNHREPDSVPFDVGGMTQSGINRVAYAKLRDYLRLPDVDIRLLNIII